MSRLLKRRVGNVNGRRAFELLIVEARTRRPDCSMEDVDAVEEGVDGCFDPNRCLSRTLRLEARAPVLPLHQCGAGVY